MLAAAIVVIVSVVTSALTPYDDFHYPSEEPAERASAPLPTCVSVNAAKETATLVDDITGKTQAVPTGGVAFGAWHVLSIRSSSGASVAVERNFNRWGLLAILPCGKVEGGLPLYVARKSVGALDQIVQPRFNLTRDVGESWWSNVDSGLRDYAMDLAIANLSANGEPTFAVAARMMVPQRDIASISNPDDVTKFVVAHSGRIKCATRPAVEDGRGGGGGIVELQDQHAPPYNDQTIIFDPADFTSYWPRAFAHAKAGLVGSDVGVANIGAFTSGTAAGGFEMIAFSPITAPATTIGVAGTATPPTPVACTFSEAIPHHYLATDVASKATAPTLAAAETLCSATADCGGITQQYGSYSLRVGPTPLNDTLHNTTSWSITNLNQCHPPPPQPTTPGLNYMGSVYVRFRTQDGGSPPATPLSLNCSYFLARNATGFNASGGIVRSATAEEFYTALLAHSQYYAKEFGEGMTVELPDEERRMSDMANAAMKISSANFVGNQANYGNGGTYWSYGREDNGSLVLDITSVDGSLLGWGKCKKALGHIGFYLENYINGDGTINYYDWGTGDRDSLSDYGLIVDLYIKAVRTCRDMTWAKLHLPAIVRVGEYLLAMRAKAKAGSATCKPSCCAGMVIGAPEHDFGSDTTHYYFNVQAWTLRGMVLLGHFLSSPPTSVYTSSYTSTSTTATAATTATAPLNSTLGHALLADAKLFAPELAASVKCSLISRNDSAYFMPVFAGTGAKPFSHMTESRDSSYANFRFWSEQLRADVLPRDVEKTYVEWHNHRGGRVAGASRFERWLDDMPTAGWGYGALTSNRTDDFLALFYGQAATYHSRGTFHTTEQLSYKGEGHYRDFLHISDPDPYAPNAPASAAAVMRSTITLNASTRGGVGYYQKEQDVSFCVVSQQIIPRMMRWMVVFDDFYRFDSQLTTTRSARVWLARAAPKRWFTLGGFNVTSAPCLAGDVSYSVIKSTTSVFTYDVIVVPVVDASDLPAGLIVPAHELVWSLRWPGALSKPPTVSAGVQVVQTDMVNGFVSVRLATGILKFQVTASL